MPRFEVASGAPRGDAPRLLIVPGLHDSGPTHWQSWLASLQRDALRVRQVDWARPDLDQWAARIDDTLRSAGRGPWIAAAHSFGCLALAHWLNGKRSPVVVDALLVAPADPARFGIVHRLNTAATLPCRSTVVASDTDSWMSAAQARRWAEAWDSHFINLGDAGHINAESGFGTLPLAARWVQRCRQQHRRDHAPADAWWRWSFAI